MSSVADIRGTVIAPVPPTDFDKMDRYDFCRRIDRYIQDSDVTFSRTCLETLRLEEVNEKLELVVSLRRVVPEVADRVLFYELASDYVSSSGERHSDLRRTLMDIYDVVGDRIKVTMQIKKGDHPLWKAGLASLVDEDELTLSDAGRKLLLGDDYSVFCKGYENLDRYQFSSAMNDYVESSEYSMHKKDTKNYLARVCKRVNEIEMANPQLSFITSLSSRIDAADDRLIFYLACEACASHSGLRLSRTLDKVYNKRESNKALRLFKDEKHPLQMTGLVEVEEQSGFFGSYTELTLSTDGKKLFFEEEAEAYIDAMDDKEIMKSEALKAKNLFFPPELRSQLDMLRGCLEEDNYKALTARLEAENLPKGIAVLLYGAPGTGKTERVMQIARATGRDIYHVDIAESKSCWFGESEKLIKGIFKKYRSLCKRSAVKPILLFNEADAIFSKRKDVASGSVAQTENAIQNIILEEMENLDGILIATTNLTENLDPAFERRFLFKIRYERPSIEAKRSIWKDKMPILGDKDVEILSSCYDFSGGEIDNIVRKSKMKELLEGRTPTLDSIRQLCDEERIAAVSTRRIGFAS